ncbi:MAG: glycosyltransferase [Scytolyngbya sp. HA4215-MV1]|jgi:cellulose synthase (UDP-forming)|nr:glycosyltransferase [Scytolyngbya sp. HA4215-MV1]
MKVSLPASSSLEKQQSKAIVRPQWATVVMLSTIVLTGAICTAWFAKEGKITRIFAQLNALQEHPPLWLKVPMVTGEYLLFPSVLALVVALGVMKASPRPQNWSRWVVGGILLVLTTRYVLWRALSTLNLSDPQNGIFSLGLFFLEMLALSNGIIQLVLMLRIRDRKREADQVSQAVLDGTYAPTVEVLIPTYNEPTFILKRTIMGCQAMEYLNKKIYVLDDTHRPEVRELAETLGCEYMTRPDNHYAKAGNLNHAIAHTTGELIVVFDADFIPTTNFLTRTLGFFQNPQVALVQTPQSFYNSDPIARNLGLESILTSEEEVFYRQIQPIRDGAGSVICSGTSFVIRRKALEEAGYFVTESLSEDYFTGIRVSAKGYQLVYLDEKLSAGLATENMAAHATQRLRWARGTLQAFFIDANPLTISGLSPIQRLAHLEGLLHWFTTFSQAGYLLMPLAYSFLKIIPIRATTDELMYFFLPYYVVQLSVFSWLNYRSRSLILSNIYSLVLVFPIAFTVIQAMFAPFSRGFKVTPKGLTNDRFVFNWKLALPLILLFVATAVSLWRNLGLCMIKGAWMAEVDPITALQAKGIGLGWLWSAYNLIMLGIALLVLLDAPRPDGFAWFDLRRTVRIQVDNRTFWGVTTMMSEGGVEVALTEALPTAILPLETQVVSLEIMESQLTLQGRVTKIGVQSEFPTIRLMFEDLSLRQHRALIEMLFCRPGQWKRWNTPGELQSVFLLFKILFKPRILFDRKPEVSAISVSKV